MRIDEWPVYINDTGVVTCSAPECDDLCDGFDFSPIGRRTTFGEMKRALVEHALVVHEKAVAV